MKLTGHTYACNSLTDFAFQALVMNKNENYGNLLAHCLKKKLSNHLIQRHSQAKKQNSVIKQILKTREIDSSYVLMLATVWQILHFKHLQWTETEIMGICWNLFEEKIDKSLNSGELIFWRILAIRNQNEGVYLHPQILPGIKANHVPLKDCITLYNPRFSNFPPALCRTSKWRFHNSVRYGGRCKVEVGN